MTFRFASLLILSLIATRSTSLAYESEDQPFGYLDASEAHVHEPFRSTLTEASRLQKFGAALDALGIPQEADPDFSNFVRANAVNENEMRRNLPYIDPDRGLMRYLSISKGNLQLFRDFFSSVMQFGLLEFQQSLSTDNSSIDSYDLIQNLKLVSQQVKAQEKLPLRGLKVLIDPGHMGGDEWDRRTGKFVEVNGRKVSEGDLTLWTSLLTAKQLESLGATVLLTRRESKAVATSTLENFNVTPHLNSYFHNSMDDWMAPYLEKPIDEIRSTIRNAPEAKKAFASTQRLQFYLFNEDLEARSKMIDAFQPDVTLVVHYDASKSDQLQSSVQALEAFVPGAFRKNETGGRKSKALALKHLLEVRRWNQTIELADRVTAGMSKSLEIPRLNKPEAFTGFRVRDGVYTRNLALNRRIQNGLMVYLECLHYDHVDEHPRLAVRDRNGSYQGKSFQYPSRLDAVAEGIEAGMLDYFRHLSL
jgi:N-acetylmuramoyl-L-alanine amidase